MLTHPGYAYSAQVHPDSGVQGVHVRSTYYTPWGERREDSTYAFRLPARKTFHDLVRFAV